MRISESDKQRIAAAIAAVEARTSGEVRCALARKSGGHGLTLAIFAIGAMLLVPALNLAIQVLQGARPFAADWNQAPLPALIAVATLGAAVVGLVLMLLADRALVRWLTPDAVLAARVRKAALVQFEAEGLTATRDRTGVLIFASLTERRAEVLADEGVMAAAPDAPWGAVVAALVDGLQRGAPVEGFIGAIEQTGEILAPVLPPRPGDANELPDELKQVN